MKMNDSQRSIPFRAQAAAAQLRVTLPGLMAEVKQLASGGWGVSVINYGSYNQSCTVSVVEVPELLESVIML